MVVRQWRMAKQNLNLAQAAWPEICHTLVFRLPVTCEKNVSHFFHSSASGKSHLLLMLMFNSYSVIWCRCRSGGVTSCGFRKCEGVLWYRKSRNTCKICRGKYFSFLFFFNFLSRGLLSFLSVPQTLTLVKPVEMTRSHIKSNFLVRFGCSLCLWCQTQTEIKAVSREEIGNL